MNSFYCFFFFYNHAQVASDSVTKSYFILISFISCSQVVTVQDYWVKPRSADINENVLSEQAREEMGLSEELIRTKGNSLEQVLSQVKE